jgi:uncharacterized protein (TIGR03437 family)
MPGLRLRRAAALVLALPCLLSSQGSERDQGFRANLAFLARELPARHANVFHTTTRAQFDAAVEALDRDIPRRGGTEVMVRLAQIVASVGDSHTNLTLPQGPEPFRRFPLTFYGFEDGWRVDAASQDYPRLPGCRIVRIGDTPIEILDLRNNTGGRSTVLNPFIDTVQARGYRFAAGTRKYVIIGRSTASSAMLNAMTLKQQPHTVLIGEPTGGRPGSYGEVQNMRLPYSGATVNYSKRFISAPFSGESIMPDWAVPTHARDTFSRHDPFLAAALAGGPPPAATPDSAPLVNGASYRPGPVAPGSLATLFLDLPGVAVETAAATYPERLAGVEVRFNGLPAPLIAVTAGQVNLLVPADLPAGQANLQATRDGVEVLSKPVLIAPSSPGLFLADPTQPGQPGAVWNQDSSPNTKDNRARRGEIVRTYATGVRTAPRAFVAGEPAEVIGSSLSARSPGVWEFDIVLPGANAVAGQVPLFLIGENGAVSNGVTLWVEP